MVKKYKMVSIVYGGSGSDYAKKMNDMILKMSDERKIPIRPVIILENILTGDLLTNVTKLFADSDISITFLTADDVNGNKKRVRQNVVFELAMALFHLGKEKCIILSDFDPKSEEIELPSDMNGLEIKCFNKDDQEKVFQDILAKVLLLSKGKNELDGSVVELPSYDHLLTRDKYRVDYENLFTYKTDQINLAQALEDWYEECKSLKRYEERAVFFIERVGFLPIFGKRDGIYDWYKKIEPLLTSFNERDIDESSLKLLNFVKNTIQGLITYVCYSFNTTGKTKEVYDQMIEYFEDEEPVKGITINPLMLTVYYDYLGLCYMHEYEYSNNEKDLERAIELFSLIVDNYIDVVDTSLGVWSGFLYFNLARAYRKKYLIHKDDENKNKTIKFYKKACLLRNGWLVKTSFPKTIRNALSIEYFMAVLEQIDFQEMVGYLSAEQAHEQFVKLKEELSAYYVDDEKLEKLANIQDKINDKINQNGKIEFKY